VARERTKKKIRQSLQRQYVTPFKLRRKNSHRKTSLDNLVSAVLSDYLHFSAHRM